MTRCEALGASLARCEDATGYGAGALAGIRVNDRPVADRCVQPDAHGTVDVLTHELVFVVWLVAADQDPHEDPVVQLVDDDLGRERPRGLAICSRVKVFEKRACALI
jgi:hypothetical protein